MECNKDNTKKTRTVGSMKRRVHEKTMETENVPAGGVESLDYEMAIRWQEDTGLPMIVWIDEAQSCCRDGLGSVVKFQLDTSSRPHKAHLGSMDLDGNILESKTTIRGLSENELIQLRNFVRNNKHALRRIADMEIHVGQIWPDIIKGGEPATDEQIAALNAKVEELVASNKAEAHPPAPRNTTSNPTAPDESGAAPKDLDDAVFFVNRLSVLYTEKGFRELPPVISSELDASIETLEKNKSRGQGIVDLLEKARFLRKVMPEIKLFQIHLD